KEYDTQISLGMPNKNAYPGHKKVGWEILFKLPFLVKTNCNKLKNNCKEVKQFDNAFDTFYKKIENNFSFIIHKDYKFINWRVSDRPFIQYNKYEYRENNDLKGYIILKNFNDNGYKKSHILDIHAENKDALQELISVAITYADKSNELNLYS